MASMANINALQDAKFHFVVATKLRSMSKSLRINDLSAYQVLPGHEKLPDEERVLVRVMDHPQYDDTRMIVTYSPSRARKDRNDRERLLEKLQNKLAMPSEASVKKMISNSGYKKYTSVKEGSMISLDEKAVEEESMWDGFHGLAVSKSSQLDVGQALDRYHDLWRVEEAFRVAKCTLKTRPIFHHASHRVRTHVLVCFMNLFLERYLERLLQKNGHVLSSDRIRYALSQVHTTIFADQITHKKGAMQSSLPPDAEKIFLTLGISTERETTMNP
jgi:transposase